MKNRLTIKDLQSSACAGRNPHLFEKPVKKKLPGGLKIEKRSKEKEWLSDNLTYWANEHALELKTEYQFHAERKWRFDWCIPGIMVAVEFEGLFSEKSRHTTVGGYTGDTDKYREAAMLGYTVLRYTAINHKQVLHDLNKILQSKNHQQP